MVNSYIEVEAQSGGSLPQLDATTFEEQLVWLVLTFVMFYFIVSRFALPKISAVLENREEVVASDLDMADIKKREAEDVKSTFETSLEEARSQAQAKAMQVRETGAQEIAKVKADLDARLSAEAAAAEAKIADAVSSVMAELDEVSADIAGDLVKKVSGHDADKKALAAAVKTARAAGKEA